LQGVKPINSVDELAQPDLWESDEEHEAFLADLYASCRHRVGRDSGPRPGFAGGPRPISDAWIAACCLVRELPLATLNIKDYADLENSARFLKSGCRDREKCP
jgi:predicted nucleic acid-binding protein